jgi:hypothetical protein
VRSRKLSRGWTAACATALLLVGACTALPVGEQRDAELAARVNAIFDRRGLGPDALLVIDNILRHEGIVSPTHAPPIVREILAQPLAAVNAGELFDRAVPAALRKFVEQISARHGGGAPSASIEDLVKTYVAELAGAQAVLRSAGTRGRIDAAAVMRQLDGALPDTAALRDIAAVVDPAGIDRGTTLFLAATGRFVRALRAGGASMRFPDGAVRFDSPIGVVVIGTRGDDTHGPAAALIVDPGGNDRYERVPANGGAVSVIVDLAGDDRYGGSDLAVHGFSAIVDFSGNDRYEMAGPGLGAAIAGAAVLADLAGDDIYESSLFGQGAAAFGLGALIDLRGNDSYRVRAGGQGFAMAGGVGLLWDRAGNDHYVAAGLEDAYRRGGGISMAQGAATGLRTMLGGGIGLLRDDSGDDSYRAEMYAQGTGYYYSVGQLWDRAGNDDYHAVRYAQGAGVHEAVGLLRDESGDDRYTLNVGVGQGMGLDLAVGALVDAKGDDSYQADVVAQGAATGNGFGLLFDAEGADRWSVGNHPDSWGHALWSRRLPTSGLLVYDPVLDVFARGGDILPQSRDAAAHGGPNAAAPSAHESSGERACPPVEQAGAADDLPTAEALRRSGPGLAGGASDPAAYAVVLRRLTTQLQPTLAELPADDFNVTWALSHTLRCALIAAAADQAGGMWQDIEQVLATQPETPFAGALAYALRGRPAPTAVMEKVLAVLDNHPRCNVRALSLSLRERIANDDASRARAAAAAQAALGAQCWRMAAEGLVVLERLGIAPERTAGLPSFLRSGVPPERK